MEVFGIPDGRLFHALRSRGVQIEALSVREKHFALGDV